jgi:hypothetical protein
MKNHLLIVERLLENGEPQHTSGHLAYGCYTYLQPSNCCNALEVVENTKLFAYSVATKHECKCEIQRK